MFNILYILFLLQKYLKPNILYYKKNLFLLNKNYCFKLVLIYKLLLITQFYKII